MAKPNALPSLEIQSNTEKVAQNFSGHVYCAPAAIGQACWRWRPIAHWITQGTQTDDSKQKILFAGRTNRR